MQGSWPCLAANLILASTISRVISSAARAIAALDGLLPAGDVNMTTMAREGDRGVRQTCTILMVAGRQGMDVKLLDAQVLPSRYTPCICTA